MGLHLGPKVCLNSFVYYTGERENGMLNYISEGHDTRRFNYQASCNNFLLYKEGLDHCHFFYHTKRLGHR